MIKKNTPADPLEDLLDARDKLEDPNDEIIEPEKAGPPPLPPYRVFKVTYPEKTIFSISGQMSTVIPGIIETITGHFWSVNQDGSAIFGEYAYQRCTDPTCGEWHLTQMARRAIRHWVDITEVLNVASAAGGVQ